jgi:hypothetical protein
MSLSEDQHPVGELSPDREHKSLGETVRPRTARRNLEDFDAHVSQHRIEGRSELAGPIPNEKAEPHGAIFQVHHQVPGLLSGPYPSG